MALHRWQTKIQRLSLQRNVTVNQRFSIPVLPTHPRPPTPGISCDVHFAGHLRSNRTNIWSDKSNILNMRCARTGIENRCRKHNHNYFIHNLLAFLSSYSHSGTPLPESDWLYKIPRLSPITNAAGLLQPWLSSLSSSLSFLVPIIWWSATDLSPCFSQKVKKTSVRWKFLSTFTIESATGSLASTPY